MASTEKELSTFRINAVENETVYQAMVEAGQVVEDELYFVGGTVVGGVTSVNGQTGDVELVASDIGAVSTDDITQTLGASTTKVPSEKAVSDALSSAGAGDMLKAAYDPNSVVSDAGGIPAYVEANGGKIDTIKVNGTAQTITDKTVDITVPTDNNQLTNGAGYITSSGAPVQSVNNKTGSVSLGASDVGAVPTTRTVNGKALSSNITLSASDVGALPSTTSIPSKTSDLTNDSNFITSAQAPVQSVNNKTGTITLTASDVGALPDTTVIPTVNDATLTIQKNGSTVGTFTANASTNKSINITMAKSDVGLSNVDNVKQYSADNPPPYPVTSVAGRTGAVTLSKSDVGLGNVDNVQQYSASNPPPYPVTSVNGETGDVTIEAGGGTTIVLSETEPSGLSAGDYWYQIVT